MNDIKTLRESDEAEIRDLLVGHRIILAEEGQFPHTGTWGIEYASGRLTLDDGTQVLVVPNEGGCACGGGDYALTRIAAVDNIITSVRVAEEDEGDDVYGDRSYRIYVFADAAEINVLSVDGNDGSGYYGTGYELIVIPEVAS